MKGEIGIQWRCPCGHTEFEAIPFDEVRFRSIAGKLCPLCESASLMPTPDPEGLRSQIRAAIKRGDTRLAHALAQERKRIAANQ